MKSGSIGSFVALSLVTACSSPPTSPKTRDLDVAPRYSQE